MKLSIGILFGCVAGSSMADVVGPFPDGVAGSGFGCENQCDGGDVNYVIHASLETYLLPNSKGAGLGDGTEDVSMFTRTFVGNASLSSPFCRDYDGTAGPLAPCMTVNPGQTMRIKIINDMQDGMELLGQSRAGVDKYWALAKEPGQPGLDEIPWFGKAPERPEDMIITNEQDLPGYDATFDDVNIHLHGMQVVPHLFLPQGTGDPSAPWITIQPANENPEQQCFCYVFEIPEDHPQGTFFWHIHRHGSVAMQGWQGMVGLLQVGNADTVGSPDSDLATQNITRDEPLVLWEWGVNPDNVMNGTTFFEGGFLDQNMVQVFVTNNAFQPTVDMCVNETVHFRLLCALTTTGSAIFIQDESNNTVPFYVFASDGISYGKAYEKTMLVVGPGQREGLLIQLQSPGTYYVMQNIINDFQDEGEVSSDNPLAPAMILNVTTCDATVPVDITSLDFTPGMTTNITNEEVSHQISVNFQVQSQLDRAPVPQFVIDGLPFDYRRISHTVNATSGQQWTLTSNMNYFHPFHIHVNPFQVKTVTAGYLPGTLPGGSLEEAVLNTSLVPANMWRDTVFIPPYGVVSILQRFGEEVSWAGKSVYHCHFLDHEDQGMIAAMVIANPDSNSSDVTDAPETVPPPSSPTSSTVHCSHVGRMTMLLTTMVALFVSKF